VPAENFGEKHKVEKNLKKFTYDRWLIFFIVLGLAAALAIDVFRHEVEENNKTIELAADYESLLELAQMEGIPADEVLAETKKAGITSLAVYETTLEKLNENGKVTATAGAELIRNYGNGTLGGQWRALAAGGRLSADCIYITSLYPDVFAEVKADIVRRFGEKRVETLTVDGKETLVLKANYEKAVKQHLGMPSDEMKKVNDAGFHIIARPTNYASASEDDVRSVFARIAPYDVSTIVFSNQEALGYPDHLEATADAIRRENYVLGMIEHPLQLQFYKQEGLMEIASALDYRAARLYAIPKDEQVKMKLHEAVERWMTTNPERNIRINLLRPFDKPAVGMSLLETNVRYFSDAKEGLLEKGYAFGVAGVYENYRPTKLLFMFITLGAAAAGVLYLSLVHPMPRRWQYILLGGIAAILLTPYLAGRGNLVRAATATASASLFPTLAMIWQMDRWRASRFCHDAPLYRIMGRALGSIFVVALFAAVGASYVSAVLTDVTYLLEIQIFRGVKLTFVLPLILVSIAFLQRFNLFAGADYEGGFWPQAKRLLNAPIRVKSLLALGLAAVAVFIFIGRSGHTAGVPVPALEIKLRTFLEQTLYARPRSKEFLIGHPAFMLTVLAVWRKWPRMLFFVLVVTSTIGMGSMVETFAHMRTPVFMSLVRGINGLLFGSAIGLLAMAAADLLYSFSSYVGRDTAKHE